MPPAELPPIEIDCASVESMLAVDADFLLLDCREENEHQLVHLEAAQLMPMSTLASRAGELSPHRDRRIVVMCHLGGRSLHVAQWLREQGFAHTQSMTGGIDAWATTIDTSLPRY
jgi:rhodanese-related sulfurtransferase